MIRTITCLMIVLFYAPSSFAQAKRGKLSAIPNGKCAVTVRDDLVPDRTVVVVGCDSLGFSAGLPSNGGIVVLDDELNLIFKWTACSACGGFFSRFAGTKKVKGHNALMVKLVGGSGAGSAEYTVPLYFNGKKFTFAEMPSP